MGLVSLPLELHALKIIFFFTRNLLSDTHYEDYIVSQLQVNYDNEGKRSNYYNKEIRAVEKQNNNSHNLENTSSESMDFEKDSAVDDTSSMTAKVISHSSYKM
jgi:hypothetical protein